MEAKQINKVLCQKLKLVQSKGSRHTHFQLVIFGNQVVLPTIVQVSRGTGDLSNRQVHNIANSLGLNEPPFKEMIGCHIGRPCVILAIAVRMLNHICQELHLQGMPFGPGCIAMRESVSQILDELELEPIPKWNSKEQTALKRPTERLQNLTDNPEVGKVAVRILELIKSGDHAA